MEAMAALRIFFCAHDRRWFAPCPAGQPPKGGTECL